MVELVEHHVHRAEVGGVGVQEDRLARERHRMADARHLPRDRLDPAHHILRLAHRGRVGQLDVDQEEPLVLRRDEPGRGVREPPIRQPQQAAVDEQHQGADPEHPAHDSRISIRDHLEADVERRGRSPQDHVQRPAQRPAREPPATTASVVATRSSVNIGIRAAIPPERSHPGHRPQNSGQNGRQPGPPRPRAEEHVGRDRQRFVLAALLPRPEQERGERGAERQRVERGDDRRRGDRHRELLEELADDPLDERARDEHRRQYQADCEDRPGDLLHRLDRGVPRPHSVLDVVLDRLDDHDRVVNDDPDRQHQPEQRQVVEAEPERGQNREGADDRHRHGDQRDHRRPPVLEEQQDHDGDEDDCLDESLEHLVDRFGDERRGVVDDGVFQARGEPIFEFLHPLADELRGLQGVRSRSLVNREGHRGLLVEGAGLIVSLRLQARSAPRREAGRRGRRCRS